MAGAIEVLERNVPKHTHQLRAGLENTELPLRRFLLAGRVGRARRHADAIRALREVELLDLLGELRRRRIELLRHPIRPGHMGRVDHHALDLILHAQHADDPTLAVVDFGDPLQHQLAQRRNKPIEVVEVVDVRLELRFFTGVDRPPALVGVLPARVSRVIPAGGGPQVCLGLVDRNHQRLDLRGVGKLRDVWRPDDLIAYRCGLVEQIREVLRIRVLPHRLMAFVLPLAHDDLGLRCQRQLLHECGVLEVVHLLRITGRADDPPIDALPIDVQHLAETGADGDGLARDAPAARLLGVAVENFQAVDLAPHDFRARDRAPVLWLQPLRRFRDFQRLPRGLQAQHRAGRWDVKLSEFDARLVQVVVLRDPHGPLRKPVLGLIPKAREVHKARATLSHRGLAIHRRVLLTRDVLHDEPEPRIPPIPLACTGVEVDRKRVLDHVHDQVLIGAVPVELGSQAGIAPADPHRALKGRGIGDLGVGVILHRPNQPLQHIGGILVRLPVFRIDMNRGT